VSTKKGNNPKNLKITIMKNLATKIKDFRTKALNNWFTKEFVSDEMTDKEMIGAVAKQTREQQSELHFDFLIMEIIFDKNFKLN
jgi:ferritin